MLTKQDVIIKTYDIKNRVIEYIKKAEKYQTDPDKVKRVNTQKCIYCYYTPSIAGQAFTTSKCKICNNDILNSTTNYDMICINCAKEHSLCKKCGSDLELRTKRKKFKFDKTSK